MTGSEDGGRRPVASERSARKVLDDALITGRLVAHGPAPYQFRRDADASYFVKVLTQRGERTLWGRDLARAIRDSQTKVVPGDMVGVRRTAREAVSIRRGERTLDGRITQQEQAAHRNRWIIEKVAFFAERARLARRLRDEQLEASAAVRRPELKSTFLTLRAARAFAEKRIRNPADQERFVSLVKDAIAGSVRSGEPLPTVKLDGATPTKMKRHAPAEKTRIR
jgi:putative DNA primase/helicase